MVWFLVIMAWAAACLFFFLFYYKYHFFYQEQNQLFLLDEGYLTSYLSKPAWVACLVGDFLTQFYYYLYAGPLVLTLALLAVGDSARRALQRCGIGIHWAFLSAILLMTLEAVFCLRTSYRLSSVIALWGGLVSYLIVSRLCKHNTYSCALTIIVASVLTYWMWGYGLWILQTLLVIEAVTHLKSKEWSRRRYLMFIPALLFILIYIISPRLYCLTPSDALFYPGMGKWGMPDFILEKDLAADNEYYFGNWHKVEEMVEKDDNPTDEMLFFYNLIKAQKEELPNHLMRFNPNQLGTFYKIGPESNRLTIINMNELYWALGDMTLTERAAMMTNVFSPDNRNVRMIKRLAESNLVSGDSLAAMKYLRILSKTMVYRSWAEKMIRKQMPDFQYILDKQQMVNRQDTIRLSDNLHLVMMQLLDSNPRNTTALDYILCSTLLLKDITNFKRDYDRYCYNQRHERIKPLYQQALMIHLAGTQAPKEEWEKYIHDQDQLRLFSEYNNRRGDPAFSDTYWYYFDTAKTPQP